MDAAWFAVLVLYVIQILHQKPGAYGLLLAVAALGGIATGGLGPRLTRRLGPWRSLLLAGLVMAATQAVLGLTASVIIAAVMLFASSAAWALFSLTAVTMRQRQVPAALLGRVSSLYGTVGSGAEVLGAIGGGRTGRHCRDPRPHARRGHPHRWRDHPAGMAAPGPRSAQLKGRP